MNEQAKLLKKTVLNNPYIPHSPFKQQQDFLTYPTEELLYGGQAGGGKSDCLLMAALQYVDEPDYNALLLRRTYKDLALPNAIMNRCHAWMSLVPDNIKPKWNGDTKTFTFPSGATLTFGYLAHNNDLDQYQGSELQFVGFDELTQFTERQYRYLHSRLRKLKDSNVPIRMRGASNPGGRGHEWVKKRFIVPDAVAPFIPSAYTDNPYLDQEDYSNQLDKLDELTRQQLKYGNWDAVISEGLLMNREQFQHCLINSSDFAEWQPSYACIGVDPASTGADKFAMALLVYFDNNKIVLVDCDATSNPNPEYKLRDFIIRNQKYLPRVINFEREPGSSPHFALNYWINLFSDLSAEMGFYITDTMAATVGNKYNRAYPHAYHIRNGNMFINRDLPVLYDEGAEPYSILNAIQNQYIYVHPDKTVMEDYPSPDELDSISYAFEEMQKLVSGLSLTMGVPLVK